MKYAGVQSLKGMLRLNLNAEFHDSPGNDMLQGWS